MQAQAKLYNSSFSPRKMRLLADLVRGMKADKAIFVLKMNEKRMYAHELEKLLRSAVANWKVKNEDGHHGDESELVIETITIDSGRMLKRVLPAPQGRAHRIRKRSNHITIVVGDRIEDEHKFVQSTSEDMEENVETVEETVN